MLFIGRHPGTGKNFRLNCMINMFMEQNKNTCYVLQLVLRHVTLMKILRDRLVVIQYIEILDFMQMNAMAEYVKRVF